MNDIRGGSRNKLLGTGAVMNPGDPRMGRMPQAPTDSTYRIHNT